MVIWKEIVLRLSNNEVKLSEFLMDSWKPGKKSNFKEKQMRRVYLITQHYHNTGADSKCVVILHV